MSQLSVGESNLAVVPDCPFCNIAKQHHLPFDANHPINDAGDFFFKPDFGMMMPGHFLAVTKEHFTSFAQLGREKLEEVDRTLDFYEDSLSQIFGSYFRIEHGSDNIRACGSGACIEHAHTHLFPADADVGAYIQEQLPWQKLDSYEDLAEFRGHPYIYLGRLATHGVVADPRLPGQWARRQIAAVRGLEHWDWAVFDSKEALRLTFEGLKKLPSSSLNRGGE